MERIGIVNQPDARNCIRIARIDYLEPHWARASLDWNIFREYVIINFLVRKTNLFSFCVTIMFHVVRANYFIFKVDTQFSNQLTRHYVE